MKKNVFLKSFLTNLTLFLLVLFLSNCEDKDDVLHEDNHAAPAIYKDKINDYWNQLKSSNSLGELSKIEELSTAIDTSSLEIFDLRTTEKLLIADAKPLEGLSGITKIIFYLNEDKVVRSSIVMLKTNISNTNHNKVIQSILNADKKSLNYSGEVTFLSLSKIKMLYNKYEQGTLIENATLNGMHKDKMAGKTQGSCVEYWWITRMGGEIVSRVYLFTICDCSGGGSGGGGGGGGEELSKKSDCAGAALFMGGSGASSSTSYKPNLPAYPLDKQTSRFTDPDGVCTEYIFDAASNSWQILQVILPNMIIPNNRDNYGILEYQWPVNNLKVFDPTTNLLYTYEQGSDSWIGVPATDILLSEAIEEKIDDSELNPCPKAILDKLKKTTNNDIAQILKKLGVNKLIYLQIKTETPTDGKPAQTVRTDAQKRFGYTIRISPDYTSSTRLFRASNILHETLHAYFMSLIDQYNSDGNLGIFADTPTLFQAFCDKKYPLPANPDLHHAEMANMYVNTIAAALQEFQTGVPFTNGIPDQIYMDLAWGGLRGTPIYNQTFPAGSADYNRIEARYAAESNGGTSGNQTAIGTPCN
ncbi:hypothetical protein [Flavobacterium sp. LC2016-01]|uniref:hypothetical protein n=1 Tax=Flavobacterium sp. LC2016-01 TaxID=2675876 RepID=UPI0018ACD11C|nr:hypothetical protein [Flavobacterium sp. LC2016-01]